MEQTKTNELTWDILYKKLREHPELDHYSERGLKWMSILVMHDMITERLKDSGYTEEEIHCFMQKVMDEVTVKFKQLLENQKNQKG